MSLPAGWVVHRYQTVTSTMDVAARLAAVGARDRTAVLSVEQTAGRGRGGRAWQAPAGSGLFCTLLIRPPVAPPRLSPLPLLTGVAVARAIEGFLSSLPPLPVTPSPPAHSPILMGEGLAFPLSRRSGPGTGCPLGVVAGKGVREVPPMVRLKWPNDVWLGDDVAQAKVAGILVSSRLAGGQVDYALIGIGINVRARPDELPPGATSLLAVGVETTVEALCAAVLGQFDEVYRDYLATAGHPSLDPWRARAALLGDEVTIEESHQQRCGTFVDVDDDGALLLRHSDGSLSRIVAGDLIRGPKLERAGSADLPKSGALHDGNRGQLA